MVSNEDETKEYVITGSVDDTVKVWEYSDQSLKLKQNLTGFALGVVSLAVSSDGTSKNFVFSVCINYFSIKYVFSNFRICI